MTLTSLSERPNYYLWYKVTLCVVYNYQEPRESTNIFYTIFKVYSSFHTHTYWIKWEIIN